MKISKLSALSRKLMAVLVVFCMAVMFSMSVCADTTTNQAVMNDANGVVQIKLVFVNPDTQNEYTIQSGTGFLINDSTVITCNHVVTMTPAVLEQAAVSFGVETSVVQNNCGIRISVLRDLTIEATVQNSSTEMDYAILNLSSQLYDRTYLPIRSSASVQQTEEAFAVGFPGEVEYFQDVNTYTSDDVTITSGRVNKLNTIGGVDYIQTSTRITEGNSGCPLVDANGAVIGICQGSTGDGFDQDYFYAIAIDQLTQSLNALGIDYTEAGVVPQPDPSSSSVISSQPESVIQQTTVDKTALSALVTDMQSIEAKNYTTETADAFSAALSDAQSVLANEAATQEQVDAAQAALNSAFSDLETAGSNMMFVIIAVLLAIVVVVVIVIVILTSKKKKTAAKTEPAMVGAYPGGNNGGNVGGAGNNGGFVQVNPMRPPVSGTTPIGYNAQNAGAGETTVLNQGAGETTVLNQNTSFGTLTRSKNREVIKINSASFIIGKERAKVSYCVMDNTSVSRTHATINQRGGTAYIMDMRATNGTFVNGVRLNPGQEVALKNGDVILLADEEFTYHT